MGKASLHRQSQYYQFGAQVIETFEFHMSKFKPFGINLFQRLEAKILGGMSLGSINHCPILSEHNSSVIHCIILFQQA